MKRDRRHERVEGGILIDPRAAAERADQVQPLPAGAERGAELLDPNRVFVTPGWHPTNGLPRVRLEVNGHAFSMPAEWAGQLGANLTSAAEEAISDSAVFVMAVGGSGHEAQASAQAAVVVRSYRELRTKLEAGGKEECSMLLEQLAQVPDPSPEPAGPAIDRAPRTDPPGWRGGRAWGDDNEQAN